MTETKPIVKIKNWNFSDLFGYWHLTGEVQNHPRFEKGEQVKTSKILRVETKNTIYELED